jgi:hypothetical protein
MMCWTHPYRVGLIVTVQYSTINMNRECAIDSGATGVNGVAPPVVGVHVCTTSKGVFWHPSAWCTLTGQPSHTWSMHFAHTVNAPLTPVGPESMVG